jgi:hypothetical protein
MRDVLRGAVVSCLDEVTFIMNDTGVQGRGDGGLACRDIQGCYGIISFMGGRVGLKDAVQ